MYSNHKHHVTYKGLAPSWRITFIGEPFEGSIYDKEIVKRSGILNKNFLNDNDSVMADTVFTIQHEPAPFSSELNNPLFLVGRAPLTEKEVKESQTTAFIWKDIERAITRIRKFKAFESFYLDITWFCKSNLEWFMYIVQFISTFNTEDTNWN